MNHFDIWQRWLFIVGVAVTAFGLFMALFNQTGLFELFARQIDQVFGEAAPSRCHISTYCLAR